MQGDEKAKKTMWRGGWGRENRLGFALKLKKRKGGKKKNKQKTRAKSQVGARLPKVAGGGAKDSRKKNNGGPET